MLIKVITALIRLAEQRLDILWVYLESVVTLCSDLQKWVEESTAELHSSSVTHYLK